MTLSAGRLHDVTEGEGSPSLSYALHCMDALQFMATLPDGAVDVVVVDPPYGIGENNRKNLSRENLAQSKNYGDFDWDAARLDRIYFDEMRRVSAEQVIFGGNYYTDYLPASSSWIVWDKLNGGNDFADCELAWTSHKRAVRRYAYMWNGMIKQMPEERYHPTQKPLSLMIWVLENYTKPGDLVFDPCFGSCTTGVAALKTGRRFVGCERDAHYHAIGLRRLQDAAAQLPLPFEVTP